MTRRPPKRHSKAIPLWAAYTGLIAAVLAVTYLSQHPQILILVTLLFAGGTAQWLYVQARRHRVRRITRTTIHELRQLDPTAFEHAIAQLCKRDGCRNVRVVGGAGDLAADVLATTPDGQRILIQAKRYADRNPVRSPALQAVNGTYRDIHGADLAAVVTTSTFTKDARSFGRRVGIHCFDQHKLAAWASKTGPAPWQ